MSTCNVPPLVPNIAHGVAIESVVPNPTFWFATVPNVATNSSVRPEP